MRYSEGHVQLYLLAMIYRRRFSSNRARPRPTIFKGQFPLLRVQLDDSLRLSRGSHAVYTVQFATRNARRLYARFQHSRFSARISIKNPSLSSARFDVRSMFSNASLQRPSPITVNLEAFNELIRNQKIRNTIFERQRALRNNIVRRISNIV